MDDRNSEITNDTAMQNGEACLKVMLLHSIVDGGIIQAFNQAAEHLSNHNTTEIIDQNVRILMTASPKSVHHAHLNNLLTTDSFKERKRETQRKDEESQGNNQELDIFTYIASHDLKEPFCERVNNTLFLQQDYQEKSDKEGIKRLNRMNCLCNHMEILIDKLLYFFRIDRQKFSIKKTDINAIIQDIKNTIKSYEGNIEIRTPHLLLHIVCDYTRITEIFKNLIDNGSGISPKFHYDIFKIFKRSNIADHNIKERKLLKVIKQDSQLKGMPIIILTTSPKTRGIKKCHKLGINTCIQKPLRFESLIDAAKKIKDSWVGAALLPRALTYD